MARLARPRQARRQGLGQRLRRRFEAFGGLPTVSASLVDPNQNNAYLQQYENALQTALNPTFQQQDQQLADSNAARGITSSGAGAYLQGNLQGQQAGAVASGTLPLIQQGYGYTQQDLQGNQQAQNAATGINAAGYYNEALTGNANAYNSYEQELLGLGGSNLSALEGTYLGSYAPNSGVESGFGTAIGGIGSTYGSVYGAGQSGENAALGAAGTAAGAAFG